MTNIAAMGVTLGKKLKAAVRARVDARIRDAVWALKSRRDATVLFAVVRGLLDRRFSPGTTEEHLTATIGWLRAAQDATAEGGVSAFFDMRAGEWAPPYPETTGYIIPTFFDYAAQTEDQDYRKRATRMADWLLTIQLQEGAFPIGPLWPAWERIPIIFDTGQIVQGLVRTFQETGSLRYLEAASRAGNWLTEVQDADGCWRRFTPQGNVHTYNVRVAWALLQLHLETGDSRFHAAADRNLRWAMTQQAPDGYFSNMSFFPHEAPLSHTIAYTIEGLMESGIILTDTRLIGAARLGADKLMDCQKRDGYVRARYGPGWESDTAWACLTGNAQMALIWLRLYERTGESAYLRAGMTANRFIKSVQVRDSSLSGVAGGVGGSYPTYAEYEPYRNLNWAAKFFVDSLLLEQRLRNRQQMFVPE